MFFISIPFLLLSQQVHSQKLDEVLGTIFEAFTYVKKTEVIIKGQSYISKNSAEGILKRTVVQLHDKNNKIISTTKSDLTGNFQFIEFLEPNIYAIKIPEIPGCVQFVKIPLHDKVIIRCKF